MPAIGPRRTRFLCLAAFAAFFACSDDVPTSAASISPGASRVIAAGADSEAEQQVARALALALREPRLRASVRDAMRASPFTEHKLVLHEYAATESGQALVAAGAAALRIDVSALHGMIAALPPLDFYAPFREHRRQWTGSANLAVVATTDTDARTVSGLLDRW